MSYHDTHTPIRSTVDLHARVDLRPGLDPARYLDQRGRVWLVVTVPSPSQRRRARRERAARAA